MNRHPRLQRKGWALALAMLAMVVLTLTGMALLNLGFKARIQAIRAAQGIQARWAADGAVHKALAEMNREVKAKRWSDTSMLAVTNEALFESEQSFSYQVAKNTSGAYTIKATGRAGAVAKRVSVTLRRKSLFDHAILTRSLLTLKAGTLVDGYNSDDTSITDVDLKIATTATAEDQVILNTGVKIDGDVFVGTGGDPAMIIKDLGATTGDRIALTKEAEFLTVTPPTLPYKGVIDIKATTSTIGPSDSGRYDTIMVAKGGQLTAPIPAVLNVAGGDVVLHVTGNFEVQTFCEVNVAADSSLTIYIDGNVACGTDSSMGYKGPPQEPEHLQVYGTSKTTQTFDIKAKSFWSGVIYAPQADIVLRAGGDMYGAVVSKSFEFKAGGNFYYDEALRNISLNSAATPFEIARWRDE